MGCETNTTSIRELERQIEEGTGDIIQLKRARNSLLNIFIRVPPEILGSIFRWNVIPDRDLPQFGGLPKGTYNFLPVCHHWFEVASRTPELWSFWGITLEQWSRRYRRSGTTPVDLVLNGYYTVGNSSALFDTPLRDALRDRAACDAIRSVHLQSEEKTLLASILSSLTPDGEDVRCSSIESISLRHVDVSNLFARYCFPKLRYLHLSTGIKISSWEHLGFHTTALTTLNLVILVISPIPTTSQLLSFLSSNPRLRNVTLSTVPADSADGSTSRVALRHLRKHSLSGDFLPVLQLLHRLDHPEIMDEIEISVFRCAVGDILGILGPYLRDYLRHRGGRLRDGLGIFVNSHDDSVSIQARTTSSVGGLTREVTFATFAARLWRTLPTPAADKLCIDLVAYTPREHVVYFGGDLGMDAVRGIVPSMPGIQELRLTNALLSDGFLQPDPDGPLANTKLLPSLRRLRLENIVLKDDDWSPLLPYLVNQTSGGQRISLTLSGYSIHICTDVVEDIEGFVDEFILDLNLDGDCPFDYCSVGEEDEG